MSGLEYRYDVKKVNDPDGKHDDCRYFVLDPAHDRAAWLALEEYAWTVRKSHPELSKDLYAWLWEIQSE
jgi:hypothetical protein